MRRSKSREIALQILFSLENGEVSLQETNQTQALVTTYLANFGPRNAEETADIPYLQRLLAGILSDLPSLDEELEKHSEHWKVYRMSRVDRNVLRIGVEELKTFRDIPPKVTLDECVELAKKFGTDDSSAFVNGILDKVRQSFGREEV
jgi:N utilization substance protein B